MTVAELIEALQKLPADQKVMMLWDGAARSEVDAAWSAQGGFVVVGPQGEPVYHTDDRVEGAPSKSEQPYLKVGEMLGLRDVRADEDA